MSFRSKRHAGVAASIGRRARVEHLEDRRLLSGALPQASADAFTTPEDTPLRVRAGENKLTLDGNSALYAGAGTFTDATGTTGAGESSPRSTITLEWSRTVKAGVDDYFYLYLNSGTTAPLAVGHYANAMRFGGNGTPWLDFDHDSSGVNALTGSFDITSIGSDAEDKLTNFAVSFHIQPTNYTGSLDGVWQYHYAVPGAKYGVLANDTDAENDPLTAQLVTAPAHGNVILLPDGSFSYTPNANFNGPDTFTYAALDGTGQSMPATVSLDVTPVNDPPSFTIGSSANSYEDSGPVTFLQFATNLSAGPPDEAGQTESFMLTNSNPALFSTQPVLDPVTGALSYTPAPNAFGTATLTAQLADDGGPTAGGGQPYSAIKQFSIDVKPVNDAPTVVDDAFSTAAGTPIDLASPVAETSLVMTGTGYVLDGAKNFTNSTGTFTADSSNYEGAVHIGYSEPNFAEYWDTYFAAPAGQPLLPGTYTDAERWPFEEAGRPGLDVYGDSRGSNTVTGQFTVLAAHFDATGKPTSFAATFEHHSEGSATSVIRGTVKYNYTAAAGVLANDSDVDGDKLTASLVTKPLHGTVTVRPDGTFRYVPDAGFAGVDTFSYAADDGTLNRVGTVRITVAAPPPPIDPKSASLSGTAFNDSNANGVQDGSDTLAAGKTVFLDTDNDGILDAGEASVVTDSKGGFSFKNLAAGTYHVRRVFPSGYAASTASIDLTLAAGQIVTGLVIGSAASSPVPPPVATCTLSGFSFDDTNKDGVYESTETKTSGKTVFLDANNNGKLDAGEKSVVTGSGGVWSFAGLAAGTYHVRRVFPTGYAQSNPPIDVTLTAGQVVGGLSIGSRSGAVTPPPPASTGSIAGFAFNDVNKNGLYDGTDTLAAGKTIFLDTDNDGLLDAGEASVVTDSRGNFAFKNLAAGTYHVRRVEPTGYVESTPLRTLTLTTGQAAAGVSIGSRTK